MNNKNKAILTIFIYFFSMIIGGSLIYVLLRSIFGTFNILYIQLLINVFLLFVFYKFFGEEIKKDFLIFKQNWKGFINSNIKYLITAFFLMILSNLIIFFINGTESIAGNEEAVRDMINSNFIFSMILVVFFAPVIEEIIFRFTIKKLINRKIIYVLVSGISFGLIHVAGFTNINEFLYIIPYSIPGVFFALSYVNSKNVFVPISLHFFHNSFTAILITTLGMLG